jgi:hypothetical protein
MSRMHYAVGCNPGCLLMGLFVLWVFSVTLCDYRKSGKAHPTTPTPVSHRLHHYRSYTG